MKLRLHVVAFIVALVPTLAHATIALSSPLASNTYVNTVPVSWSVTTAPSAVQMVWTYTGGYYTSAIGQKWTLTLNNVTSSTTRGTFTFNPSAVLTDSNFSAVSPSSDMLDGTYSVAMTYTQAANGLVLQSSTVTNVTVSTHTIPPLLASPAPATTVGKTFNVSYTLPSTPTLSPDGITLTFTGVNNTVTLNLSYKYQTASFTLDTTNLTGASPYVTSASQSTLPDDTYAVALSYSDVWGHAAAGTTNSAVIVETTTPTPTLTTPATAASYSTLSATYTLPVAPLHNSVTLTVNPGGFVYTLPDSPLTNTYPIPSPGVPNGTAYTVTLSYQDSVGNPAASASATNVAYHLQTNPPTLTAPSDGSVYNTIPVAIALPDAPLSGSVQLAFTGAVNSVVTLADGTTTTTLDPHNLAGSPGVASATTNALADGPYRVVLTYQDAEGQPAAASAPVTITVETVTQQPLLLQPASNSSVNPIPIQYVLAEAALPGSVQLLFSGPSNATLTMVDYTPRSTFYWDPSTNPSGVSPVVSATGWPLAPGVYTVVLSYRDRLGNPAASTLATNVTVALPTLTIGAVTVSESAGTASVPVTLTGSPAGAVTVRYATADGTALAGTDYTATSGTLTWSGSGTQNISVPLTDNLLHGAPRTFRVNLASATGASIASASGTVTILENDARPTLTVADTAVNETAGEAIITVTMSQSSGAPVSVSYATSDGTAVAGVNYTATSGTLTWAAGQTGAKTFTIPVIDDQIRDGNLTVDVTLSAPVNATINRTNATLTIDDNETASVVLVQPDGQTAVDEGGGSDSFQLVLSSRPTADVTVTIASGSLVAVAPAKVTFTAANWQTPQTVTVTGPPLGSLAANATALVGFSVASGDSFYDGYAIANLLVTIHHVAPPDLASPPDMATAPDMTLLPADMGTLPDAATPRDATTSDASPPPSRSRSSGGCVVGAGQTADSTLLLVALALVLLAGQRRAKRRHKSSAR